MTEQAPTFVRVCRKCSAQAETAGDTCPACGTPYVRPSLKSRLRGLSKRSKIVIAAVLALLIIGGAAAGAVIAVKNHNDHVRAQKAAAAKASAAAKAKAKAAAAAKAAADAKAALDKAERTVRHQGIAELQRTITADARKDVANGVLTGPILSTSCTPLGGGSTDDLNAITTTFTCLAIQKINGDGTESGYNFSATMNWNSGEMTWRLGN